MVQLSHHYMTTGKTIALTRWTFVSRVVSLFFNMLSKTSRANTKTKDVLFIIGDWNVKVRSQEIP